MPLSAFAINPPLINSSNPWATTAEDLLALYNCPYTGAVTIRTSLLKGFEQTASKHRYTFFDSKKGYADSRITTSATGEGRGEVLLDETSSLNTLGYSPIPFNQYTAILVSFSKGEKLHKNPIKPFLISVTGTAEEVAECYRQLVRLNSEHHPGLGLMMEINLSCPNIHSKPPPAYSGPALSEYISALLVAKASHSNSDLGADIHIGIKTPPFTYHDQFSTLISCLESALRPSPSSYPNQISSPHPISFITATNTLGSCLVLNPNQEPALEEEVGGVGIGGMAGSALHPLALGNVKTIRNMLDASERPRVRRIQVIGIGGVENSEGWRRMRKVGASCVGVGTAFGRGGVDVFQGIAKGLREDEFMFKCFGDLNGES